MKKIFKFDDGGPHWYEVVFDDLWLDNELCIRQYKRGNSNYKWDFFNYWNGIVSWPRSQISWLLVPEPVQRFAEKLIKMKSFW